MRGPRIIQGDAPICSGLVSKFGFPTFGVTVRAPLWVAPAKALEMAIDRALATRPVETTKVALSAPVGTVTLAGTATTVVSALERATTAPLPDTGPFISTVPWEVDPPTTELGFSKTAFTASGLTVSAALAVVPYVAEIATAVADDTVVVVIGKVAVVAPAATVTFAGTLASEGLFEESWTCAPCPPAASGKVTVPCEEMPPSTLVGFRARLETEGGETVSGALRVPLVKAAEMVTDVDAATLPVAMGNEAVVEPPGTVTLAGTEATDAELLERGITVPPAGAADGRATLP